MDFNKNSKPEEAPGGVGWSGGGGEGGGLLSWLLAKLQKVKKKKGKKKKKKKLANPHRSSLNHYEFNWFSKTIQL